MKMASCQWPQDFTGRKNEQLHMVSGRVSHLSVILALITALFCCTLNCFAQSALVATISRQPRHDDFQGLEDRWSAAVNSRNLVALRGVLSPQLEEVSPAGDLITRDTLFTRLSRNQQQTTVLGRQVMSVRIFGDLAVVIGTYEERGDLVDSKGMFTHIYQKIHETWSCVHAQETIANERPEELH